MSVQQCAGTETLAVFILVPSASLLSTSQGSDALHLQECPTLPAWGGRVTALGYGLTTVSCKQLSTLNRLMAETGDAIADDEMQFSMFL